MEDKDKTKEELIEALAKMRQQITELERSNRELQDFAHIASHDLQEPLRKIQTFGVRLKIKYSDILDDQGLDYLKQIQKAATRMQSLIEGLLTFSQVSSNARPFTSVNLTNIGQEVLSDLETHIEEVKGQIEIDDLPTIEADPLQMRQLLQNLIGNALKFHQPQKAPIVKVYSHLFQERRQAGPHPPGTELCQIIVEDNGIGFEAKHINQIFDIFQRLHDRTIYDGTGVGLAVCRKIVERHRGSITAKSSPGRGAMFIVTLPVKQGFRVNS